MSHLMDSLKDRVYEKNELLYNLHSLDWSFLITRDS